MKFRGTFHFNFIFLSQIIFLIVDFAINKLWVLKTERAEKILETFFVKEDEGCKEEQMFFSNLHQSVVFPPKKKYMMEGVDEWKVEKEENKKSQAERTKLR